MQKIKNLTFDHREGALEEILSRESREKRTVDDVLGKNEGYRDEIARLFWAMARAANLQAYMMRVADPSIPKP